MSKFIFSFLIIGTALSLGYAVRLMSESGRLRLPLPIEDLRKRLQKTALLIIMPVTVLSAIWIVNIRSAKIAALPFIGFGAISLGGLLALGFARMMKLEDRKTGALFTCGSFTNIGSIGALVCFLFLGEAGFALVPIYKIFEELTYYAIGFPIARYYSAGQYAESPFERLKGLAKDPFIIAALSAILIGGALNLSGVPRPAFFHTINAVFIPLGTGMLIFSIGLAMKFKSVTHYFKECLAVSAIKFLIIPVIFTSTAWAVGFGEMDSGLPLKVVLILTSMPVAFNALIPPSIYDLDLDLANSCWFFTTTALIVVLPVLLMIIGGM